MNDLIEYNSFKLEIERLNKQMDLVAGFYHRFYKGEIAKLKKRLAVQVAGKHKAIKANTRKGRSNSSKVLMLIDLRNKGKLVISDREIAEICFVTIKNVKEENSRVRNGKK